uniref:Deoxyhypusine synthase n=1 Tax=Echinostoma caproni TaxID=27848 RepID=A0A183A2F4_9TREM
LYRHRCVFPKITICMKPVFLGLGNLSVYSAHKQLMKLSIFYEDYFLYLLVLHLVQTVFFKPSQNKIPVFCPGLTDGALGDVLFSHTFRTPGFRVDIVEDVRRINLLAIYSRATAMIVLGGGIVKHHTFNANLMRNGSDYVVLINTGQEFDGSDSGARPDEAVSWGKIRGAAEPIKITGDASLIFPLLVACTFAKHQQKRVTT